MSKFIDSSKNKQELINCYEELRRLVLDKSRTAINKNSGYSILCFRGMPTWIKTCLSSELIYSIQSAPSRVEKIETNAEKQPITLPPAIQGEAVMILTNIILSHQIRQKPGNCYV